MQFITNERLSKFESLLKLWSSYNINVKNQVNKLETKGETFIILEGNGNGCLPDIIGEIYDLNANIHAIITEDEKYIHIFTAEWQDEKSRKWFEASARERKEREMRVENKKKVRDEKMETGGHIHFTSISDLSEYRLLPFPQEDTEAVEEALSKGKDVTFAYDKNEKKKYKCFKAYANGEYIADLSKSYGFEKSKTTKEGLLI
ncbi:hypothetical protein HCI99_04820 [Listeria booriae]|uniref:Uncharacterized protein n=1 Tax=Listeria booriae TaxID=1552123 RepID=A0A7X0XB49_9LIST|nr:hypothetical protein [Listeria booriae]MBC1490944.1 hypothetical protein [Listeria booriae]MBC1491141.1 hypothetical protein [Listeria booriae]MBC6151027.1 hypothetical protein [Listeria booriae]MBC6151224.1 hypothetical protein [Listeria booriae]